MAIKVLVPKVLGKPLGMYSHGVVAPGGELVVVAGQVGISGAGKLAGPDVIAQAKQAFKNIRAVLATAGCTMRDVVRFQTFLTGSEHIEGFMQARREVFPAYYPDGAYPPNTLLVISRLVRPELLVEIEAMAVKPGRAGAASPSEGKPRTRKTRATRTRR